MSDFAKRGLGRGLSALLGEPVKADFGAPKQTPTPANAPAWIPPSQPAHEQTPRPQDLRAQEPPRAPAQNVFELPKSAQSQQSPPPQGGQPQAPAPQQRQAGQAGAGDVGPRGVAIDLVQRNPQQPRKHFDEGELTELANSIRTHGVLQPILVRPIPGGRFEIVAGERRWRAAQRAGLHTIPAVIREFDEVEVLEIAIVENVQRTDLNPIEEAQGFQALIDRFNRTQEEIADAVGKSRPHIANMLRLLKLPEELQEMVRDGRLTAGHARAILTSPDQLGLARRAVSEGLNVREVERLAQQAKDEKHGPRHTSAPQIAAKDADTLALERSLADALGLTVNITDKNGQGELKISYRTLEQLDDLVRRLRGGS
jgi:ParB family chromosome partitioning protein